MHFIAVSISVWKSFLLSSVLEVMPMRPIRYNQRAAKVQDIIFNKYQQ